MPGLEMNDIPSACSPSDDVAKEHPEVFSAYVVNMPSELKLTQLQLIWLILW